MKIHLTQSAIPNPLLGEAKVNEFPYTFVG